MKHLRLASFFPIPATAQERYSFGTQRLASSPCASHMPSIIHSTEIKLGVMVACVCVCGGGHMCAGCRNLLGLGLTCPLMTSLQVSLYSCAFSIALQIPVEGYWFLLILCPTPQAQTPPCSLSHLLWNFSFCRQDLS